MNKFITPIILIAISVGIFFTFIQPQYKEVKAKLAVSKSYSDAIKNSNKLLKEREVKLKKFNQITEEDRDKLEKLVPDDIDNVRLIIDINEVARKYGSSVKDIKVDNKGGVDGSSEIEALGGDKKYSSMNLSFSVAMTYENFIKFLKDLESSLRILDVESLSFRANDLDTVQQYGIVLKTYWLKDK